MHLIRRKRSTAPGSKNQTENKTMDVDGLKTAGVSVHTTKENDVDELGIISYNCDKADGSLDARFSRSVKHLVRLIEEAGEGGYWLQPVLIANDVDCTKLSLPKYLLDSRVRVWLDNQSLYITELSAADSHNAGLVNLIGQSSSWNSNNLYEIWSDSKNLVGGRLCENSSPDLVLAIPSSLTAPGEHMRRAVVIDLEVSNRSPEQMRTDLHTCFAETTTCSVLGIKCFGTSACPAKFACAVLWSRSSADEPLRVAGVWDFGFLPLQHRHRKHFESELHGAGLPPVLLHQWVQSRYIPVSLDAPTAAAASADGGAVPQELNDPADVTAALTFVQNLYPPHAPHALYHKRRPRVIISGQVLTSFLHNPPDVPRPLLLPDFEVDLGALFYALVRTPRV